MDPSGHFVFSVGVEISYAFLLGYYKTVAIAIDGKGDSKILMTVGGIVNTAFGSASCSIVGCLYVNYNSVQKVTSGISSSIGGVVSVGKSTLYQQEWTFLERADHLLSVVVQE